MSQFRFFIAALATLLLSNTNLFAQAVATAQVGATIVVPTTVSKESDMEFGHVTIGRNAGTTVSKNATMELAARKVVRASIKISGVPDYTYSITIPARVSVSGGKEPMTVGTEVCSESGEQMLSKDGTDTISIEGSISYGSLTGTYAVNDDVPNGLPVIINNN